MSSDLLDGIFIKVARVSHHPWDAVCVLETLVELLLEAYLVSLLELSLHHLLLVDILHPALVGLGPSICYMALEDDHVVVGDGLRVGGGVDWCSIVVNGVDEDWGASRYGREGQIDNRSHVG